MPEQLNRIEVQLAELHSKVDAIYASSEKMRKYFLWTLGITLVLIILPLLFLPALLSTFMGSLVIPEGL